jgi:hypothetical protein
VRALDPLDIETSVEVNDLFARYNQAADRSDPVAWAATFAKDGVYDSERKQLEGRDALIEHMTKVRDEPRYAWARGGLHLTVNSVIRRNGRWATATSNFVVVMPNDRGQLTVGAFGVFTDELVRDTGAWLIKRRVAQISATSLPDS